MAQGQTASHHAEQANLDRDCWAFASWGAATLTLTLTLTQHSVKPNPNPNGASSALSLIHFPLIPDGTALLHPKP
jgi:hypothetical protein